MSEAHPAAVASLLVRVPRDGPGLAGGQRALAGFLAVHEVGERGAYFAELAFEELVSNALRHGAAARSPIEARVRIAAESIVLTVEDEGPAFDPSSVPEPPVPATIEEAPIGGRGLALVRRTSERMTYERLADRNRVTVTIARREL